MRPQGERCSPCELQVLLTKTVLLTVTVEFHRATLPAERPALFVKLLSRIVMRLDSFA